MTGTIYMLKCKTIDEDGSEKVQKVMHNDRAYWTNDNKLDLLKLVARLNTQFENREYYVVYATPKDLPYNFKRLEVC